MKADFHIHSNYSDGDSPPEEIVELAIDLGLDAVGIVDHVNAESTWVGDFASTVSKIREKYADRICVLSGLETKCRNTEGELDIPVGAADSVDFIVGAIHRVPDSVGYMKSDELTLHEVEALDNWTIAVTSMLNNPVVDVWAHPGRILTMNGIDIPPQSWYRLSQVAAMNGKYVELTTPESMTSSMPIKVFEENGVRLIPGSDSHSLAEVSKNSLKLTCYESAIDEFLSHVGREE